MSNLDGASIQNIERVIKIANGVKSALNRRDDFSLALDMAVVIRRLEAELAYDKIDKEIGVSDAIHQKDHEANVARSSEGGEDSQRAI